MAKKIIMNPKDRLEMFWKLFDALSEKQQNKYLNDRFGDLMYDITRDWNDETLWDEIKTLKQLKQSKQISKKVVK